MPVRRNRSKRRKTKKSKTRTPNFVFGPFIGPVWNDILKDYTDKEKKPSYEDLVKRISDLYYENKSLRAQVEDYRNLIQEALKRD